LTAACLALQLSVHVHNSHGAARRLHSLDLHTPPSRTAPKPVKRLLKGGTTPRTPSGPVPYNVQRQCGALSRRFAARQSGHMAQRPRLRSARPHSGARYLQPGPGSQDKQGYVRSTYVTVFVAAAQQIPEVDDRRLPRLALAPQLVLHAVWAAIGSFRFPMSLPVPTAASHRRLQHSALPVGPGSAALGQHQALSDV
jgi:hypothetical protein